MQIANEAWTYPEQRFSALSPFIPKDIAEESWKPLESSTDFAVRSGKDDVIFLRLGQGHGVYLMIAATPQNDRHLYSIDFESGDQTLLGKISGDAPATIGRTAECSVKILHAIVSRQHVRLRLDGSVLIVRDLGSTNGTFYLGDSVIFDIRAYLEAHPLNAAAESTLDWVHESFGPTLDDFLKRYSEKEGKQP